MLKLLFEPDPVHVAISRSVSRSFTPGAVTRTYPMSPDVGRRDSCEPHRAFQGPPALTDTRAFLPKYQATVTYLDILLF
jgi:hypothetical protein